MISLAVQPQYQRAGRPRRRCDERGPDPAPHRTVAAQTPRPQRDQFHRAGQRAHHRHPVGANPRHPGLGLTLQPAPRPPSPPPPAPATSASGGQRQHPCDQRAVESPQHDAADQRHAQQYPLRALRRQHELPAAAGRLDPRTAPSCSRIRCPPLPARAPACMWPAARSVGQLGGAGRDAGGHDRRRRDRQRHHRHFRPERQRCHAEHLERLVAGRDPEFQPYRTTCGSTCPLAGRRLTPARSPTASAASF